MMFRIQRVWFRNRNQTHGTNRRDVGL
jgi:hypothetical protein